MTLRVTQRIFRCASALLLAAAAACARAGTGASVLSEQQRGTSTRIVLDGQFDDWRNIPVWARFGAAASPTTVAPLTVQATDDAHFWYLSIALRDTVALSSMPGTMHLLVDADDNAATGATVYGTSGVDVALDLSRLDKRQAQSPAHGAGVALRTVSAGGLTDYRSAYERAVLSMPTWGAPRFELRIARSGAAQGSPVFGSRVRARLVFVGSDSAMTATAATPYTFAATPSPTAIAGVSALPAKADGAVRLAHWNVSEGSFRTPNTHAALIAAVAPDIIVLDEMHGEIDSTFLAAFFARPELARLGSWRFVYGRSGGRQRGLVATRGRAIRPAEAMAFMRYPEGALDSLARTDSLVPKRVIEIERGTQIASTGAWVDVDGVETLIVPVDLTSGGYFGSPADAFRLLQARTIRRYILDEIGAPPRRAPVIIAGDFNSVASYASVEALQQSLDTDGSALSLNSALRLDGRSTTTWRNVTDAQFTPGRLDLALYPDRTFTQTGGFVFASEDLSDTLLASLGLTRAMSQQVSDHLIVVTDLRRRVP
jgi:endonuclease/exonuclease/phosphatase (EEP) superfamily protein YafD